MRSKEFFIDLGLSQKIFELNFPSILLLFVIAYLFFVILPQYIFPQKYAGVGLERKLSNILYMLAYIELLIPVMVLLKIFNLFMFIAAILLTKLLFYKFYEKKDPLKALKNFKDRLLIALFDFADNYGDILKYWKKRIETKMKVHFASLDIWRMLLWLLMAFGVLYMLYVMGYRCFITLSSPLPDNSQFIEWVANLQKNVLYADNKTAGADFYGLSVFVFVLQVLTNIDSIILFSIYPLILIAFLLFGVYFVMKRFLFDRIGAFLVTFFFAVVMIASPLNDWLITPVAPIKNPEILRFFGLSLYTIPKEMLGGLSGPNFTPYARYFGGMAYEFASSFFLINLYYLIKSLDKGRNKDLLNYALSLLLVFIFHGGGAIALIVPSIFIAINALVSWKLNWALLKKGLLAILFAAIFGNGWILSVFKYGIPQDFGAAAPFLDQLFGTQQAKEDLVATGFEDVLISYLVPAHLYVLITVVALFVVARIWKKSFFFSSFLLIPLGIMLIYFAENIGLHRIIHQDRSAEYLLLSLTIVVACGYKLLVYLPLRVLLRRHAKKVELSLAYIILFALVVFVPKYKDEGIMWAYIDRLHYSDGPYMLYKIVESNKPYTWTVVSFVEEFPRVLGKGYFINTNDFIMQFDPRSKYLEVPTKKVYIFVEDIPHLYHESDDWYYRWRKKLMSELKAWISTYSIYHRNIKKYANTALISVYEIDNSDYLKYLDKKKRLSRK